MQPAPAFLSPARRPVRRPSFLRSRTVRRPLALGFALFGLALGGWGLHSGLAGSGSLGAGLGMGGSPSRLLAASMTDENYDLGELRYLRQASLKINSEYVDPTRVEPQEMLTSALDRVARQVPQFLYRYSPEQGALTLVAGEAQRELMIDRVENMATLTVVLNQVAVFLDATLPEEIERPPVEYALMNGMLTTLDPHSVFIDPEAYAEMSIQNKGHFGGLGITIGIRDERLTVLYPLKETPAWRAGLKAGDHIDKIGSESTVNMSLQEAVSMLRGPEGTDVTITVSDGEGPDREVTITRARIDVPSVEWAYAGDGIGLIEVSHFAQQTYDSIETALDELGTRAMSDGHGRLLGLILDLRQNPGGYLQQAIEVADKFLDGGVIVSTEGLAGNAREDTNARRFGTEDDLPIVVLVDEGSASASEIVAGALQNHDRGVVMGVRTFGKGSVQNLYDRDFHSGALKMTIAQYLTPGNQSIQGVGILPDIELRPAVVKAEDGGPDVRMYWQDFELREEDLEGAFKWGGEDKGRNRPRWVYACNDCFEAGDMDREIGPEDNLDMPEVQAAKALLQAAPSSSSADMLKAAGPTLDKLFRARQVELQDALGDVGIDWSLPPGSRGRRSRGVVKTDAEALASVEMFVDAEDGVLEPGIESRVRLRVRNDGRRALHRLRAVTEGDFFGGREFFFGKVPAGETREFSVAVKPALWLNARADEVTWHFFSDSGPSLKPFVSRLRIKDVPHPRFAFAHQIIDDGSGQSRGNGDGLLQPGEEIELVVTVLNQGQGATSDLWLAKRVAEGAKPALPSHRAEDDEEKKAGTDVESVKKNGFIRLRNRSGDLIFLTKGSADFSLQPGGETTARLHFRVAEDPAGKDAVKVDLTVGDSKFLEILNTELELPLFKPEGAVKEAEGFVLPSSDAVVVRGGASAHSDVVGSLAKASAYDGRLGTWVRVPLPWGGKGWIPSTDVKFSRRAKETGAITQVFSSSPPRVELAESPGGTVVTSDQLKITGFAQDDRELRDLFVFVNEKKISYEAMDDNVKDYSFSFEIPLDEGENRVEVFARDDEDHLQAASFGVYRERKTVP